MGMNRKSSAPASRNARSPSSRVLTASSSRRKCSSATPLPTYEPPKFGGDPLARNASMLSANSPRAADGSFQGTFTAPLEVGTYTLLALGDPCSDATPFVVVQPTT